MPVDVIIYAIMFLAQQMRNSIWPGGRKNNNNNAGNHYQTERTNVRTTKKFLRALNQNKTWICIIYKFTHTVAAQHSSRKSYPCVSCVNLMAATTSDKTETAVI